MGCVLCENVCDDRPAKPEFDAITGDYPQVFTAVIRRIKPGTSVCFNTRRSPVSISSSTKCLVWSWKNNHNAIARFQVWIVGNPGHIGRIIKGNANDFRVLRLIWRKLVNPR